MMTEGTNLLLLTIPAFWSSRRQISIPLFGRYRQVSLFHHDSMVANEIKRWYHNVAHDTKLLQVFTSKWHYADDRENNNVISRIEFLFLL